MRSSIEIKDSSVIKTFLLTVQPARPGKIFLGSKQTGRYLLVDEHWRSLVKLLHESETTVDDLAKKLIETDPTNFHPEKTLTQLKIMLLHMSQNRLVAKIDGKVLYRGRNQVPNYLDRLIRRATDYIGSPFFVLTDLIFTVIFLAVLLFFTDLFPKSSDFFWSSYLSLSIFTAFVFTWASTFIHEAAHLLIGRAFGIRGGLRLSNMLNFLVVETSFPDIYSIKKSGRIAIYLSGMVIDMLLILFFYSLIHENGHYHFLTDAKIGILKQFVLIEWLSILWEFFFYMKTDVYFVIKEILGIENLYTYAKQKIVSKLTFKKINFPLNKRENRVVNIYMIFMIMGTLVGILRYFFYHVPIILAIVFNSIEKIYMGIATNDLILFFDGMVVAVIELILTSLLIISLLRKRRA
ncbi:MAG TPA: hypothetical protein VLE44_01615 [Candidatus Saccharimonadales bacterium]|nr:hypothetical protein [Candidatus Saccharimonadales bacterium]